ncbi:MAG: Stk1 family PASTA domain-containing Ser/Thr kinase [Anaerofustis stercorihominis]|nr:Stk1 family PASTA domain-containing Ser/Thr kinase [Anaerofustis stercorihominis]
MIGVTLDHKYEIEELIGQGGMANVYRARDTRLNRRVAVKILKQEYMDNEQFLKKFLREAQADAKLAHPNIVNVYDVGSENGLYYIVMEYIDGKTLHEYIKSNKRIPQDECLELMQYIVSAIDHAHSKNIIHRDIKPHNILMTSSKIPKVGDFGIARAITSSTITATQEALGSVHYISPEQARGGFLDERSDLYSLGILMYEMLTGTLPFEGETPVAVALQHVQNSVPSPKKVLKSLDKNICQIVLNLTRKKSDERYQSARELLNDINKLIDDSDAVIEPTYSEDENDVSSKKKSKNDKENHLQVTQRLKYLANRRFIAFAVALFVFIVVAVAGVYYYNEVNAREIVPDVMMKGVREAQVELTKYKFKPVIIRENNAVIPKDTVISQSPSGGDSVKRGSEVTLIVSDGPNVSIIPDVTGYSEIVATKTLTDAGFIVREIVKVNNDDYRFGTVCDQNPKGNITAAEGTEVTLYISLGKDTIVMPNLVGMTLDEATEAITNNQLVRGSVSYEISNEYSKGKVMEQSVKAYSDVNKNTVVDIVISKGGIKSKDVSIDLSQYTTDIPDSTDGTIVEIRLKVVLYDVNGEYVDEVLSGRYGKNEVVNVEMSGIESMIYKVYINDLEKYSGVITF